MPYTVDPAREPFEEWIDKIVEKLGHYTRNQPETVAAQENMISLLIANESRPAADRLPVIAEAWDVFLKTLHADRAEDLAKGDLNYVIASIIWRYLKKSGIRYHRLNDFIGGVLSECQAELRRRITAPYEDKAQKTNGDFIE